MSVPLSKNSLEGPLLVLPPELRPSVDHLVTEDDTPVDNVYSEKQMRLLTRPLYSSWSGPAGDPLFLVLANVGLFFALEEPPLVPDVLLSLGVKVAADMRQKYNRSYFVWKFGKPPDIVIEVVSNQEGGELGAKKDLYARIGIPLYVVWDPLGLISTTPLQTFGLNVKTYETRSPAWFDLIGLGLQVWHGTFEQLEMDWLRWCDQAGQVIPLGEERAEQEHQRAEQERERAKEERQRAEQVHQRAEEERQRAEQEHQRAEEERQRADEERQRAEEARQRAEKAEQRAARLAAQLRQLGIEPGNGND